MYIYIYIYIFIYIYMVKISVGGKVVLEAGSWQKFSKVSTLVHLQYT